MKRSEIVFTVLLLPLDLLSMFLAFILSYFLRVNLEIPKTATAIWPFDQYVRFILPFLPVWGCVFALEGLYNIKKPKTGISEVFSIFLAVSASVAIIIFALFFSRFLFFSRLVLVYAWILSVVFVILIRFLVRGIQKVLYLKNIGLHRVLIIGNNGITKAISKEIKSNPYLGLKLVKTIDRDGISNLNKIFERNPIDDIILADPDIPEEEVNRVISFCEEKRIGFKMVPNLFRLRTNNVEVGSIASYPLIALKITPLEGWGNVFKRVFDLVFATFFIIIFLPLFLILAILIKLTSKGPVFFKHRRIGKGGKEFYLYKFRTMIEKAPSLYQKLASKKGVFFGKIEEDPRITKIGRILRRINLDELPQLFNVLKGEMSLIGPRPLTPSEFNQVANYERKYFWVSYVRPGMTGLWQTAPRRYELSDEKRLALDIYYVENWSPLLDIWILLKTPIAIIKTQKGV